MVGGGVQAEGMGQKVAPVAGQGVRVCGVQIRGGGFRWRKDEEQNAEETGMDLAVSGRLDHSNAFWEVFKTGNHGLICIPGGSLWLWYHGLEGSWVEDWEALEIRDRDGNVHLGGGRGNGGKWTVFTTTLGGKIDSIWGWIEYARWKIGMSQE